MRRTGGRRTAFVAATCLSLLALQAAPAPASPPFPVFSSPLGVRATLDLAAPAGGRALATITVTNTGDAPLALSPPLGDISAPLKVEPAERIGLLPGETQHIRVLCEPVPSGSVRQTLYYVMNAVPGTLMYTIECTGRTPAGLLTALIDDLPGYGIEPAFEQELSLDLQRARAYVVAGDVADPACPLLNLVIDRVRASSGVGPVQRDLVLTRIGEVVTLLAC